MNSLLATATRTFESNLAANPELTVGVLLLTIVVVAYAIVK